MKKPYLLIAAALVFILALPVIGYTLADRAPAPGASRGLNTISPAAGESVSGSVAGRPAEGDSSIVPAETTTQDIVPSLRDQELSSAGVTSGDAQEDPPIRISPDKPEVIQLDRDAVNILVGSDKHLRAVPDTNRTVVLIPKLPGSTYFKALDAEGKVIMQRHVIVAAPQSKYIRIRRACANGEEGCKQFSVYYCPDMCHEVDVAGQEGKPSPAAPDQAPSVPTSSGRRADGATGPDAVDPAPADNLQ